MQKLRKEWKGGKQEMELGKKEESKEGRKQGERVKMEERSVGGRGG